MRDWTKLLLIVCVVALGAGMFLLERRISGLEAELSAAQSNMTSATTSRQPVRIALSDPLKPGQAIVVQPPQTKPAPERQPSGVINGIPYYIMPLKDAEG